MKPRSTMRTPLLIVLGLVSVVYGEGVPADPLRIVHLSDPVLPGETVLLTGGVFSDDARVLVQPKGAKGWLETEVLINADNAIHFVLPNQLPHTVCDVRVTDNGRVSNTEQLNAPRVRWVQGNLGKDATPGGWARVFGLNLSFQGYDPSVTNAPASMAQLKNLETGKVTQVPCETKSPFSLSLEIPGDQPGGEYEVLISNGFQHEYCSTPGQTLRVRTLNWPGKVFNARLLGGVEQALEAARDNGGGVVYLPEGSYWIKHLYPWQVPDNTVLRGEGPDRTFVLFRGLYEDVDEALITGRRFALENMSIRAYRNFHRVVEVLRTDAFWADNLDIVAVCQGNDPMTTHKGDVGYRGRRVWVDLARERYVFYFDGGSNITVRDCSFLAPWTEGFLANDTDGLVSQRNRTTQSDHGAYAQFHTRNAGLSSRVLNEDCNFTLQNSANKFYMANCTTPGDFSSTDRDGMTTDCSELAYKGAIASVSDRVVHLTSPMNPRSHYGRFRNWPALIVAGRGLGQIRMADSTGPAEITVDEPFEIAPDETSVLLVQSPAMDHFYVNNELADCGHIQFYGATARMTVHGNRLIRATGISLFSGWGGYGEWGTIGAFNQVTGNYLDGNSPENYYGLGSFYVTTHNASGPSDERSQDVLALGTVFRRNTLCSSKGVNVSGNADHTVIEANVFREGPSGVSVRSGNPRGGAQQSSPRWTVIRNNVYEGVRVRHEGDAIGSARILGE